MQIIQQTREEKIAMYMKLSKRELVAMLMTNQDLVTAQMYRQPVAGCACPAGMICNGMLCPRRSFQGAGTYGGSATANV